MPLQESTISLNFGQGLDSKTDPKMLVPAKLTLLQDAIFTNAQRVTKRNGYDAMTQNIVGGGSISNPTMDKNYKNELIVAGTASGSGISGQRLFSYCPDLDAWADRGKYLSVEVQKQFIANVDPGSSGGPSSSSGGTVNPTCAILGSITLFAYSAVTFGSNFQVMISVLDQTSGIQIVNNQVIAGTASGQVCAILLGGTTLAVLYRQVTTLDIVLQTVTVTSLGVVLGSPQIVASSSTHIVQIYDAVPTSSGAAIAYANSVDGDLYIETIDTTGSVTHAATIASAGTPEEIAIYSDSIGQIWVYWGDVSSELHYAVFTSTLGVVLTNTVIATGLTAITRIAPTELSTAAQSVYYSTYSGSGNIYPTINQSNVTTAGVVVAFPVFLKNLDIYSRVISFNSTNYMAVIFVSNLAPTGFLVDLNDGLPVLKFLPDETGALDSKTNLTTIMPTLQALSSTQLYLPGSIVTTFYTVVNTTATGPAVGLQAVITSTVGMTFDFDSVDAYQAVIQQDTAVLNGGIVCQYDTAELVELGFSTDPDGVSGTTGTSGSFGTGQWTYFFVYEWYDALGNFHQSAPSIGFIVNFTSGSSNSVEFVVQTLSMTQKSNVVIAMYRTISDGDIGFRLQCKQNDPTVNTLSFTDDGTVTDAEIALQTQLYTVGGAILDNLAPPPMMILWTNYGRVWGIDSENPETTIEYCKTASAGTGISFSTGNLELVFDSKYGAMTGASPMDEKTVILKESGIGYFIGDGASDAGSGSTISNFQFIPSDTGCVNSKSVILFPDGILFKSPKGIYTVSRGVQVAYFGIDVEAYNAQTIESAILTGSTNQIRFLTSSGLSLLYDYVFKQWSVFTNHEGLSSDIWQGSYVYVRTDGSIYKENPTTFLDNGASYFLLATTAWIKASSIQNFQRLRRIALLGDYQLFSGHGVQVSAFYDWDSNDPVSVVPYSFDGKTTFFQYRERLSRQKCDAMQLTIQEIVTGASGEYIDFSDLGLEIGAKKGLRKLPASQSVG